ncbi:MAG: hypothetical protein PHY42_03975 [Bacilli bacterium]|nr:hypothetical protein [Bacilli bacterium]
MPLHFIKAQNVYYNAEVYIESEINPFLLNDPPHLQIVSSDKPLFLKLQISSIINQNIKEVYEVLYQYFHAHSYETIILPILEIPGMSLHELVYQEIEPLLSMQIPKVFKKTMKQYQTPSRWCESTLVLMMIGIARLNQIMKKERKANKNKSP